MERRGRAISCPEKVYAVKECDMLICHRPKEAVALTAGQYPTMEHPMAARNMQNLHIRQFLDIAFPALFIV